MSLSAQPLCRFQNTDLFVLPTLKDNYTYLLRTPSELWVIDPGESPAVLDWCQQNQISITHILCTHHHHDHVDGVPALKQKFQAQVFCSDYDLSRIAGADIGLRGQATLQVAGLKAQTIAIPGHTFGHMALYLPEPGWIFCGDTLFAMGCGRLLEGTAMQMWDSLQRLASLPSNTQFFWGHEYAVRNSLFALQVEPQNQDLAKRAQRVESQSAQLALRQTTTLPGLLAEELKTNPFLRCDQPTMAADLGLPASTSPLEVFTLLRQRRNEFSFLNHTNGSPMGLS
ncbi:MAG: hydroxyacylglutathione hydrolase [Bdellovibrionales bacterium]